MGWDAPWHWVVIALLVIALFGYKKLPEMTRSVARSLRIFKTEMKGFAQDDAARDAHTAAQQVPAAPVAPAVAAPQPPVGTDTASQVGTDTAAKSAD